MYGHLMQSVLYGGAPTKWCGVSGQFASVDEVGLVRCSVAVRVSGIAGL